MRGIVAAGLAIVVLALAGCTDDPEPRFEEPTETPSASDPTSSAAAEPEPWEEKSKAGAEAFSKYWVDIFNDAQATGETSTLQASSTRGCVSCRDLAKQLEDIYADGGSLESNGWQVVDSSVQPGPIRKDADVVLRIDRSKQELVDGDGEIQRFPGGEATFTFGLVWANGGWLLDELVRL